MKEPVLSLAQHGPHDEAEELLPWYATGQLSERDRLLVERHLYACAACRRQLAIEKQLVINFRSYHPEVDSGWSRLKAQIVPQFVSESSERGAASRLWAFLKRPAVVGLATAQLAIVAIAGTVLLSLSKPDFHTLSASSPPARANVIAMFHANTSEADMRAMLGRAGASIVRGPTAAGAYLLHVEPKRRRAALANLRADRHVQMAEPIDGTAQ